MVTSFITCWIKSFNEKHVLLKKLSEYLRCYQMAILPCINFSFPRLNMALSRMLQSFKISVSWANDDLRPENLNRIMKIIIYCYESIFVFRQYSLKTHKRSQLTITQSLLPLWWVAAFSVSSTGSLPVVFPREVVSITASIVVIWAEELRRPELWPPIPSLPLNISLKRMI